MTSGLFVAPITNTVCPFADKLSNSVRKDARSLVRYSLSLHKKKTYTHLKLARRRGLRECMTVTTIKNERFYRKSVSSNKQKTKKKVLGVFFPFREKIERQIEKKREENNKA